MHKQATKNVPPVLKCQWDGKSTAKQIEKFSQIEITQEKEEEEGKK